MPRAKAAPAKKPAQNKTKATAKKSTTAAVKKPAVKKAPARAATPRKAQRVQKAPQKAPAKRPAQKTPAQKTPAQKTTAQKTPAQKTPAHKTGAQKAPAQKTPVHKAPAQKTTAAPSAAKARKSAVLDKFLQEQRALLLEERARHADQAQELKAEADQIAADMEPGDVQFDEESGEGTTTAIDRERDLALSMQAQTEVEEVDHALARIEAGTYGTCERCGQAIPRARLKAIPHARLCIACKSGGLSRR